MSILIRRPIPFNVIFVDDEFILLSVDAECQYQDGKRTDTIVGYKYEVVDTVNFDRIKVKVRGSQPPVITNEQLQERKNNGERTYVEFINGRDEAYNRFVKCGNETYGILEDRFLADAVSVIKN